MVTCGAFFLGILIGDGWTDPINQINYGPFLYNTGLVSERIKGFIDQKRDLAIEAFQAGTQSLNVYNLI